ncbi:hypothetical protein bgla_1p1870 (plasmid) [Burkholderia gladioli BSR3]|uniref:Uncharacterized protein n=1 Tax=Burkholderia gladioli (strain BSR3) TaxID=999541 RepID=F2LRT3_BURGS|nr:hypothetical protein bgla_1p1870 [Burkholderia gladioli BSR3]
MSDVTAELDWKQDSPYGWMHPTGWTITRYVVSGASHFMLWQGRDHRGKFDSLDIDRFCQFACRCGRTCAS